jgi:hypothetical protein
MTIIEFFFTNFWHWAGLVILVATIADAVRAWIK